MNKKTEKAKKAIHREPPTNTRVFDENGHRIRRPINHRKSPVVRVINPNKFRINFELPIEMVAKLRQYMDGKEIKVTPMGNRKVRKPMRRMTVGILFHEYAEQLTKNVELTPEYQKWVAEQKAKYQDIRDRQQAMVNAGINRIPKEEQLKRGKGSVNYIGR